MMLEINTNLLVLECIIATAYAYVQVFAVVVIRMHALLLLTSIVLLPVAMSFSTDRYKNTNEGKYERIEKQPCTH
eukprot:19106-Heterococcus_DN1.PRE.3